MPVSNPTALPAIAFSKNLLNLVLQSDDYLAAAAVKSVNFLEFAAAVAEDTIFIISWNNGVATMTAKDAPDDSGLQFPSGDGSNGYVTGLLAWFNGNPFISTDYVLSTDFTGAHPRIIFTSVKFGPDYDFTSLNAGASGVITAGVTDEPLANFMHHLELWISTADGAAFEQALSANILLDYPVTGKTTVDIHDHLDGFLTSDRPELADPSAICSNSIRAYFFKMAQFYGNTPMVRKIAKSATYVISKGGLNKKNAQLRTMIEELCPVAGHPENNRFLRQGSINKLVSPEQPEWLTWINIAAAAKTIALEITIHNEDASTFVFNAVAGVNMAAYEKRQFQCGFTQLAIAGRQVGKLPVYYTVAIKQSTGANLSAAYAFVIDYNFRPWPRYIIYENSYGAFQTIGTVGKGLSEYDRSKDDAQRAVNENQAALDGEFLEANIRIQEKGTVAIGYDRAGKRNTALLRDLMRSKTNYIWSDGILVPIGFNIDNLKDAIDGVNVYANSLQYYPLNTEENFTEDQGLDDDAIADLLGAAGSPIITTPETAGEGSVILVEFGDSHLGTDGDQQTYTAPKLVGLEDYAVFSTQLANYFRSAEISYTPGIGRFTILMEGFVLAEGEQLIISPYVLNPDE